MTDEKKEFNFVVHTIKTYRGEASFYDINKMKERGYDVDSLPYSIKILLENALRSSNSIEGAAEAVYKILDWPKSIGSELPFMPYRVLLQDYTGVPLIVDLAALRDAVSRKGEDPHSVNCKVPVDLVIDHSVQVDSWSSPLSFSLNIEKEYERNSERYSLLKWAQNYFNRMRIFPPGKGICHQVNLEYLSTVVSLYEREQRLIASPDTLVGTDSHTTMVNGLAVLGWGVGGIEAEAVMLGEPYHMPIPKVVGVKLNGELREGATPTDLVLTVTELLRKRGVVSAFVEYFGDGYSCLSIPDRATLGNMAPEYGATVGFSPVDQETISYLLQTGRDQEHANFVERYCKRQGLFVLSTHEPKYSEVLEVSLSEIEPSVAGPRNPDELRSLDSLPAFAKALIEERRRKSNALDSETSSTGQVQLLEQTSRNDKVSPDMFDDGSVIISSITSCTNTSNPTVMIGAGLIARNAVMNGLSSKPYVKCSLAPGSTVVKDYLEGSGLLPYLEKLGFHLVGYGCTTCIGNSGPLSPEVERRIKEKDLYVVAVLSGNRNFDGRIHPLAKGSFLASPMLVVAYALAGRIDFDFAKEPLGIRNGRKIYLKDIWPSLREIKKAIDESLNPELYKSRYANALVGDERWLSLASPSGSVFKWNESSTYIRGPPWFAMVEKDRVNDIIGARVLAYLEDKVTTDHISPAGSIAIDSPAGLYLQERGVPLVYFSTYGSRRGNHEVMIRGGFSNIRLWNLLANGKEGGFTTYLPTGEVMSIYEAAMHYIRDGTPLIILAGKQYGTGSSRDWAAKATKLLGVRVVIAQSFERIHRSNLVAMGVLPLEFAEGESAKSLGLKGDEEYDIHGLKEIKPGSSVNITARSGSNKIRFRTRALIYNKTEMQYYLHGGVLSYVLKKIRR